MKKPIRSIATLGIGLGLCFVPGVARAESPGWTLQDALHLPEGFSLSGSVRLRYETLDGQFRPTYPDTDEALLIRSDLELSYKNGPVKVSAEMMDSRAYWEGNVSSVSTNEVNTFELIQAYAALDLGEVLGKDSDLALTGGRFTMDMGSRRLISRSTFSNSPNSFTGGKLDVKTGDGASISLFYTLPQIRLPSDKASILDNDTKWDREDGAFRFWGGFLNKPDVTGKMGIELYLYGLDERDQPDIATKNRHLITPGARLYRKPAPGTFDFELEGVYQFGDIRTGTSPTAPQVDVSSWFLHAESGRTFKAPWQPRLSLVFDAVSGDKAGSSSYNRFDTLFGDRRFEFGPTSLYGLLGRANILSPGVRIQAKPDKRLDLMAMVRATWLESKTDSFSYTGVKNAAGSSGSSAGHQVEMSAKYWLIPKQVNFEAGGAIFMRGRFLKDAPNATDHGDTHYGYIQLSTSF